MLKWISCLALFLLPLAPLEARAAEAPRVLASIKPVHSIVAAIMQGAGTPELLLNGGASPHSYALTPADARKIATADAVFWIGTPMETFLENPLKTLARRATVVTLIDAKGMRLLPARHGGVWEADEDDHDAGPVDGHIWLNPENGIAIARTVAETLARLDSGHAALYRKNADAFAARLSRLDTALARRLAPMRTHPYIVFHDAYHYFDAHYRLSPMGAVTVASDRPPGTRRIEDIHARLKTARAVCVFSPPQFPPRLIAALTEGTSARVAELDDLGAAIAAGPQLYETVLSHITEAMSECLANDKNP